MSVSVAGLRPPFSTVFALKGLLLLVEPQVVVKTAQLLELFGTVLASEDFVHSLGDAVASICDRVVFELAHLESVRPLLFPVVGGPHEFHLAGEEVVVDVRGNLGALQIRVDIVRK